MYRAYNTLLDSAVFRQGNDTVEEISEVAVRLMNKPRDYVPESDHSLHVLLLANDVNSLYLFSVQLQNDIFDGVFSPASDYAKQVPRVFPVLLQITFDCCDEVLCCDRSAHEPRVHL